ncbi:MAG: heme o synthase [Nitrososphaerota archaeon]
MKASYIIERIGVYYSVTKPRVWYLLAYTAFGGYIAGSGATVDWVKAFIATLSVILASAGSEAIANFIEKDIDALMERTKNRPLPSGKIRPEWKALILGLILTSLGAYIGYTINLLALIFILIGVLDYVVIYVMLSKKKTPLNIVLGSVAGGAPTMVGYVSAANQITLDSVILAGIVVLWIPSHIWSLALRYKEDYMKAGIPMLPIVISEDKAIRCISSTAIILMIFSILVHFINPLKYGYIYLASATVSGSILLYFALKLIYRPSKTLAWKMFKYTSPHLAVIFTVIIIESLLA